MRSLLALLAAAVALAAPAAAEAATIVVDTTEPLSTTECGLANAITAANTNGVSGGCRGGSFGSPDRIEFQLPPRATIMLGADLPTIGGQLEIVGPGSKQLVVSGGDAFRVFNVAATEVSISDLTIADGKVEESVGSGITNGTGSSLELTGVTLEGNEATSPGFIPVSGAAIFNDGTLVLTESTVSENVIRAGVVGLGGAIANIGATLTIVRSTLASNEAVGIGSASARGGAIYSTGDLTIRESTLSGNRASTQSAPGNAEGGAIAAFGVTTIERSTLAGNAAVGPGLVSGGGIASRSPGAKQISASTFVGNSAPVGANIDDVSPVNLRSTIVAGPLGGGANCSQPVVSLGFNLEQGGSCGLTQPSDQVNTDPLLAPLAANGGPTETLALLPGSPALDRGDAALGEAADQRGLRRPVPLAGVPSAPGGDGADVGAFELQAPRAAIVHGPGEGETIADAEPSFEFVAEGAATGFFCTVDGGAPLPCASPFTPPRLGDGPHSFGVLALGTSGYGQPATVRTFNVASRQPEPRRDVPAPPEPSKPAAEVKPPAAPMATIAGLPTRTTKRRLTIRLSADQPGSTFACKLDHRPWRGCGSTYRTPRLALGRHTLRVRATGPSGIAAAPVRKTFRVIAPPHRR